MSFRGAQHDELSRGALVELTPDEIRTILGEGDSALVPQINAKLREALAPVQPHAGGTAGSASGEGAEEALRVATGALSRWSAEEPGVGQLAFMPCERAARAVLSALAAVPPGQQLTPEDARRLLDGPLRGSKGCPGKSGGGCVHDVLRKLSALAASRSDQGADHG